MLTKPSKRFIAEYSEVNLAELITYCFDLIKVKFDQFLDIKCPTKLVSAM